jgi:hypothetical protein
VNITESAHTVTLLRVIQGLRKYDGTPYHPDEVVDACDALALRAGKALLSTVNVSRSAIVQTLDHLAELDDDEDTG